MCNVIQFGYIIRLTEYSLENSDKKAMFTLYRGRSVSIPTNSRSKKQKGSAKVSNLHQFTCQKDTNVEGVGFIRVKLTVRDID